MHLVVRAWRDGTNGVRGWAGGGGRKRWKTIFRMNGLFQGESERGRVRKWNRKGETARERRVLHDFKLTIIVGCDMYYVSRGSESWAHFHGEEGNKSPLSQFEHVQLAWAPHLTANYNSSSSKSLPQLSKANLTMHSLLLASLDVQLTECSPHFLPLSTRCIKKDTDQWNCVKLQHSLWM